MSVAAILGDETDMVVGPLESNDNLMMDRSRQQRMMDQESHRYQGYPEGKMEYPKVPPLQAGLEKSKVLRDSSDGETKYSPRLDAGHLNELERFRQHQLEAEQFIKQFKRTQMDKGVSAADEKRIDREMLKKYNPWGKPSAGVAHDDTRRKKWFVDTKAGRTLVTNETPTAPADSYFKFGAPGHGAPIRNEFGDVMTDLPAAQEIRFKTHGAVNFAQNYRYVENKEQQQAYRQDLDKMVSEKLAEEERKRVADLKSEMNTLQHNPFTKLGSRDREWRGNTSTTVQTQHTDNGKPHEFGHWPYYDPFGKQGSGAPIRDDKGNVITVLSKVLQEPQEPQKAAATRVFVNDLNKAVEEQRWNRFLEKEYAKAPATDFASMVRDGKVGRPKRDPVTGMMLSHPMALSDVSRHLYPSVRPNPQLQTDLDRIAMERALAREIERNESLNIEEVGIENGFGRPGAGAPNVDGNKKRKLENVLYHASNHRNAFYKMNEIVEPIATDMVPPVMLPPAGGAVTQDIGPSGDSTRLNYVRNNVNSKHSNFYEYMHPKELPTSNRDPFARIAQYKLHAPFATPD